MDCAHISLMPHSVRPASNLAPEVVTPEVHFFDINYHTCCTLMKDHLGSRMAPVLLSILLVVFDVLSEGLRFLDQLKEQLQQRMHT